MKAAILAVGTEVTSGQILNGNAQRLAEELSNLGFDVVFHVAVPDEGESILRALRVCAEVAGLVLVTGGLGPTRDDFTRDWVAQWLGVPLEYDEPSWTHLVQRLETAGLRVAESNRQQCFFPKGAEVLANPAGTANAFGGVHAERAVHYWVLPGPPRELAAVWGSQLRNRLAALVPEGRRRELLTWQCLGKSEAELGEIVEAAVGESGLETGYRAHRPYIEIKLWVPQDEGAGFGRHASVIRALEQAISPWVVGRSPNDLIDAWVSRFSGQKVLLLDGGTAGIFHERIFSRVRELQREGRENILPDVRVAGAGLGAGWAGAWEFEVQGDWLQPEWAFALRDPKGRALEGSVSSPFKVNVTRTGEVSGLQDRVLRWAVEAALKWCVDLAPGG